VVVRPVEEDHKRGSTAPTVFSGLIARSEAMLRIFRLVQHLSASEATVLITGESGTGKELVARAVHQHSPRGDGPFVAVNCGALPGDLLESELFGHVRGAFTGAVRDRLGRFEAAMGGTLFLDEVGDLPLPLQVKLLRVLQDGTFERVGETASRRSDARVIAATNKDLARAVRDRTFRDDLYYRLRVVPIDMPPLRERREDIEPIALHLLGLVCRRYDRSVTISPGAMRSLLHHDWPGNVRELENALEYGVAVCRGQTLHADDLPAEIGTATGEEPSAEEGDGGVGGERTPPGGPSVGPAEAAAHGDRSATGDEADRVRAALDAHQWRREPTAEALGISRTTLWRKMRELGLLD
jgi:DNA-binding NtrC family response regulator